MFLFTGGGEHVDVTSKVVACREVWLERFGWHLTSLDVDSQKVNGIVLCVEWVFRVFYVVGVVVDTPQDKSFWKRPGEDLLMRVRHCTLRDAVDLAVYMSYRILGRPPFQGFYVSHLNSRVQYGLARVCREVVVC